MNRNRTDSLLIEKSIEENPDFCQWFVGFFDGEGCFNISFPRGLKVIHIRATLAQREDDAEMIYDIQSHLGGFINHSHDKRMTHNPSVHWQLSSVLGTYALCQLFTKWPPHSKKRFQFQIWKKAVEIRANIKKSQRLPFDLLYDLGRILSDMKNFNHDRAQESNRNAQRIPDSLDLFPIHSVG